MNKITIMGRQQPEDLPEASIGISIAMEFGPDAPPSLVQAIGLSIAEMLRAWGRDDELATMAQECEEIRARHQRQADHAAETLLSRPAAPRESSRTRKTANDNQKTANGSLAEEIATRKCYRCEEPYGRAEVSGCSECQPIRKLLGVGA